MGGAVNHGAVGLGDYGKPEGFLERRVPRWTAELEGYAIALGLVPAGPQVPGRRNGLSRTPSRLSAISWSNRRSRVSARLALLT